MNVSRTPLARHGQLSSPSGVGQLLKIVGVVLAVLLVSGASVAAVVVTDLTRSFVNEAVDIGGDRELPPNLGALEGGFNLLLVGVDTCEEEYAHLFGERCTGPDAGGTLNDVNILVHVSDAPRKITAISIPRDMMISHPSCVDENGNVFGAMTKQPLNAAWARGGLACAAKTVGALTGQPIDFAAAVTFGGVIEITDAIGGVEVCVASRIRDWHTDLDLAAGTHTVSGELALKFLRTRYGVGDGSDLGRIGNQQQYMTNLVRKLVSGEVLSDLPTLVNLARTGLDNVTPSTSLTNPLLVAQMAMVIKDVPFEDIVFLQYPASDDPDEPNKVVPNTYAADILWDALAENKSLQITHVAGGNDGVILEGDDEPDPTPGVGETETPVDPDVVALPNSIRGNSVAQTTCSNGRVN